MALLDEFKNPPLYLDSDLNLTEENPHQYWQFNDQDQLINVKKAQMLDIKNKQEGGVISLTQPTEPQSGTSVTWKHICGRLVNLESNLAISVKGKNTNSGKDFQKKVVAWNKL